MRSVHLIRKLKYTEKAGVVAIAGYYIAVHKRSNIIVSVIIGTYNCITSKIK